MIEIVVENEKSIIIFFIYYFRNFSLNDHLKSFIKKSFGIIVDTFIAKCELFKSSLLFHKIRDIKNSDFFLQQLLY